MNAPPRSKRLQLLAWKNAARQARAAAVAPLAQILRSPVGPQDFTDLAELESHMVLYRGIELCEERFSVAQRSAVLSRLREISVLGTSSDSLLFFGKSRHFGGLRLARTPPPDALLELLEWDGDDVFLFDTAAHLHVHLDLGEDWLRVDDFGNANREMLYIVTTPKV